MSRRLGIAAALICATALTAGCAPDPDPTPTPTGFTSEAEAFAAAEKTYRAYVDALNKVDLADPATFEGLYGWETGDALATDKKAFTQMHADGWTMGGRTMVTLMKPSTRQGADSATLLLDACVDVSTVTLTNDEGTSMVDADRGDRQALAITFEPSSSTRTGWQISRVNGRDQGPICDQ